MTCFRPMWRAEDTRGNVKIYKAHSIEDGYIDYKNNMHHIKPKINIQESNYVERLAYVDLGRKHPIKRVDLIPCGQCTGCRLDYSREWATRIMCETKTTNNNWFITLTYADEYLPIHKEPDDNGVIRGNFSLDKTDCQKFLKRLRRHWDYHYHQNNIRFYLCGEYGGKTQRPHYHCIIFNLPLDETKLKHYRYNHDGSELWIYDELTEIWGKGHVVIGKVTFNSAAYVARYMLKKIKGPDAAKIYHIRAQLPEFTLMSRKPGIGQDYYNTNKDKIYQNDEIIIAKNNNVETLKPPKYYDSLYDIDDPVKMATIKKNRKSNGEARERKLKADTGYSRSQLDKIMESKKEAQLKKLYRSLEDQ